MTIEREFMTGERDPFDYILAEKLRMTVAELHHRMSNLEYLEWRAFYTYRHHVQEQAQAKAKAEAQARR